MERSVAGTDGSLASLSTSFRWQTCPVEGTPAPTATEDSGTALLRSVMDTCADGLALVDADGVIVLANDIFADTIGASAAEATGVALSDLVLPERAIGAAGRAPVRGDRACVRPAQHGAA
jgi:PAS domain-containing protein